MHSPVHPDTVLESKKIEPGLSAYLCPKSGGVWIPLESYLKWKEHAKNEPAQPRGGAVPPVADDSTRGALICPESGRVLIRFKVGHGLNFHIERSPITGGMWLDQGEWEALKSKGLHLELNQIFTAPYQRQIRAEQHEEALDQSFRERIGAKDFQKVEAFRSWLAGHPQRRDICCYLMQDIEGDEPPLKAGAE